ncbi:hypothetical protein P175DRAFT_0555186 [Aspergillus ochraceoroseus IBT 24754]|uniref:Pre-mRNA splicing factor Clf1 n=1 Tax=Aspergillus ochraceoroseus IBT 24754 TaxID=1392256 RepID=A0A2T5M1V1_9EURO|nr:uncharacterized protein P175DRAFT_0555186 [Aspergillus ochraceoroseus IBT 24754]PTU22514.1 hypothetical protein P175DRAFT_0555186 [Aspergillus ochraceoroseus IBT 24754]
MIVPNPPVPLEGHCSVIHDNTLYTYSSTGFLAIPLQRNGTWSNLTMGEPVSDAACVTGGIDGNEDQPALYVVGGTSSLQRKPGLQRYSFNDKTWKTILPTGSVTSNRTSHSAIYIKSVSSILVYGGSQVDGSGATSDTFLLQTASPYTVTSQSGENASPAVSPILVPWADNAAALIGGLTSTKGVHIYQPPNGWADAKITLKNEVPSDSECALIRRSDGSKILQVFDMSVSPNTVTTTELVSPSPKTTRSSRKRKRDSYPEYNGTLASSTTRQSYSLAQGNNSLVVISSGSGTDSLAIFNQTSNSWVNSTKLFYGDQSEQDILGSTTTTTTTTTNTTNSTAGSVSTSSSSSGGSSGSSNTGTIIGATLGTLLGIAAVLLIILFLIKRRKDKQKRAHGGQDVDKDRLSFQDQGVEPLARSAYPMAQSPAPLAARSMDSLDIFSGRVGDEKCRALPGYMPNSHPVMSSPLITIQSSEDETPATDYRHNDKAMEAQESLPRPGDRRSNEGWSKYFQNNNSAASSAGLQPQGHQAGAGFERGQRGTLWPAGGNALPPLNMGFLEQPTPLGRVLSGSPTTEHASSIKDGRHIAIPESQSARISSADSISLHSDDDDYDHDGRMGSNDPSWPTQNWINRPPSSTYSGSCYHNTQSIRDLPSAGLSPTIDYRKHDSARTNTRGSSILIPHGEPMPRNNINSDMSWLNLKADR